MSMACHLSNFEFNHLITHELCDNDRIHLINAMDVLVATVLKMQPGPSRAKIRMIPNNPYVVASNDSIDEAISAKGMECVCRHERELLHKVVRFLTDRSLSFEDLVIANHSSSKPHHRILMH